MEWSYEEDVLSILRGAEGWDDEYDEISEFKEQLDQQEAAFVHEKLKYGWVFYGKQQQQQLHQIINLLNSIASELLIDDSCLVQYWAIGKVESYVGIVEGGDEEQLGGVGRAYRNKHPESTPDLRLYSTHEFPMRDEAARCGFRGYAALPLFDLDANQCYGVLELLFHGQEIGFYKLSGLNGILENAGFSSSHSHRGSTNKTKAESEITEILELAKATVPRLYHTQVWVPCNQCVDKVSFIIRQDWNVIRWNHHFDDDMYNHLRACGFHNLEIDPSTCHSNLFDLSISKNPLAHYAQRARMFHSFAISLQSDNNSNLLYAIRFFMESKPKDAYGDYGRQLLLRIMEMNLKSLKFVSGGQLAIVEESQKHNAIDSLEVINSSYKEEMSEWNFTTYLEMVDSCCLRPSSAGSGQGWVFFFPFGERLRENHVKNNSLLMPIPIKEKIENFMKNMPLIGCLAQTYWIVQFWASKMVEDRCYLETSDQPYAVGSLTKGVASFRKKCMTHYYFVDDQTKQDQLGPPGRVFRNGYPEFTPDLWYYTTKEFPIRNFAMHCYSRGYFALPIFDDQHNRKCIGVLEFLGFTYSHLQYIRSYLESANLCSTHIGLHQRFLANEQPVSTIDCRIQALTKVNRVLELIYDNIPQLHAANVWVPNGECATSINSNTSCMELALSTDDLGEFMPKYQVHPIHEETGKGIVGMVLASENKSCFCRNLCEFSRADQPLSHYEMSERRDVCFAICLQSSHTGDLVYVLEFFLYRGPPTYEYVRSFLNFLLPIMKHKLKSFKMASGKQLGEELVIDVIEFSEANKLGSSESEQAGVFPIKFKSVQYGSKEHQHTEEQPFDVFEFSEANGHGSSETEQADVFPITFENVQYSQKEHQHTEEQKTEEECSVAALDPRRKEGGKRKTGFNLSLEDLEPHFGKKLKDVEKELGVGRSTIKRACREYGIDRWPSKEQHKKNPSLLGRKSGRNSQSQQHTNAESTHPRIVEEETEKVTIKVTYKGDITKIELCLSLGVSELFEKVATKLNLKLGAFKLKYLDEDGDEILLIDDEDLQLCRKSQITMEKNYIQLFVR